MCCPAQIMPPLVILLLHRDQPATKRGGEEIMQGIFHRRDCMGCTRSKIAIDLTTLILELAGELNLPLREKHFHPLSNNQNQEDLT